MAKNKDFKYTITVETKGKDGQPVSQTMEKVAKSTKDFEDRLSSLKSQAQKADLGSENFKKLQKEIKRTEAGFEKAKLKSQSFGESMSAIPGPIGQVGQGVKGLGAALKVLAANPIVLVLTLIVGALTAVYKAFTSTKEGAEKLERVMSGVSAAFDVIRDKVLFLTSSWSNFTKVFTLDFWKDTANEIKNEAQAAADLAGQLQKVEDAERNLRKTRADVNEQIADAKLLINDETKSYDERLQALEQVRTKEIELAEQEAALAEQRYNAIVAQNALSDSSKEALDAELAAYEKMKAAQQASKQKQKELFDQEKALRDRQRAEQKAAAEEAKRQAKELEDYKNKLLVEGIENEYERERKSLEIQREADLQVINNLKTTNAEKQKLRDDYDKLYQQKVDASIQKEADAQKAADDAAKAKADADAQALLDKEARRLDAKLQLMQVKDEEGLKLLQETLDARMEIELNNTELSEEEQEVIRQKYRDARKKAENDLNSFLSAKEQEQVDNTYKALDATIAIAGETTAVGKAAAIAKAIIATHLGAAQVLDDEYTPTWLKPFLVGAIIAQGMAQVQQIRAVDTSVKPALAMGGLVTGPGSSTSDSITANLSNGESVMNANSTRMFLPLLSTLNQMGGGRPFDTGMMQTQQEPTQTTSPVFKTYVVSTDVSTQQDLDRKVRSRSII
jgi:hypothetical protein